MFLNKVIYNIKLMIDYKIYKNDAALYLVNYDTKEVILRGSTLPESFYPITKVGDSFKLMEYKGASYITKFEGDNIPLRSKVVEISEEEFIDLDINTQTIDTFLKYLSIDGILNEL